MIKVSVIIPVYNVEAYLRQCLDSVVNQTLKDIEIICVDDGSTDGSAAILDEYAAKDPRVKVLKHAHTNAGAARNAGMAIATGEYLAFVDSDDWCELSLYEKAYAKAKTDDADLAFWRFTPYDERRHQDGAPNQFNSQVISLESGFSAAEIKGAVFSVFNFAPWNRLCRRAFILEKEIRFQEIARSNDVCFSCVTLASSGRIALIDEPLYHYRTGMATNLQANNADTPEAVIQAWEKVSNELDSRNLRSRFTTALATSASNSIFYTLGSITNVDAYQRLWMAVKSLYTEHSFYRDIPERTILNSQTATTMGFIRASADAFEFLLKLSAYRQRLVSEMYWAKEAALREVKTLKAQLEKVDHTHG